MNVYMIDIDMIIIFGEIAHVVVDEMHYVNI